MTRQAAGAVDVTDIEPKQMPTRVLIPVVYLFGGEESKAKNSNVAHKYTEHREHNKFILVRASRE
jgi:hypothetical protein